MRKLEEVQLLARMAVWSIGRVRRRMNRIRGTKQGGVRRHQLSHL